MASEKEITNEIENLVNAKYTQWTVGLTDCPNKRRKELRVSERWHHWNADLEKEARNVEAYFIAKGMKESTVGQCFADYIYICYCN